MPWYCWISTLLLLVLLNRLMMWYFWSKVQVPQHNRIVLGTPEVSTDGGATWKPVGADDNSLVGEKEMCSGIVPGGVSYIQTTHAGGVAVGPKSLGGQWIRKRRRNKMRRKKGVL